MVRGVGKTWTGKRAEARRANWGERWIATCGYGGATGLISDGEDASESLPNCDGTGGRGWNDVGGSNENIADHILPVSSKRIVVDEQSFEFAKLGQPRREVDHAVPANCEG